jgi:DNA-binding MarR family transcriptional regulator
MADRTNRIAKALGDATARIQSLVRREIAHSGTSLAQARTLATLERQGPRPLTELAALEQVTQPSMSYLVARMELKGHVSRSADSADGRVAIVSITDSGRAALGGLLQRRAKLLAEHLAQLPAGEISTLEAALPVLDHLILALEDRRAVGSSR